MPVPFDATLKGMLEESPADWAALAGYPAHDVEVIDADVSTFSGAADKVVRIHASPDWILHLDFQTGPDRSLPRRALVYNGLLEDRHDLLVRSVLILLRPEANLANLTGLYERQFVGEVAYLQFRYQVIRVWKLPPELLLAGGLGTLPLAPISAVTELELPTVIERMKTRLLRGRARTQVGNLWSATYVLMGLRYEQALINRLLQGVIGMEESVTYQAILAKGEAKGEARGEAKGVAKGLRQGALQEARKTLLLLGRELFDAPSQQVQSMIEGIDDLERLERLIVATAKASSWDELLGAPPGPRSRRKRGS